MKEGKRYPSNNPQFVYERQVLFLTQHIDCGLLLLRNGRKKQIIYILKKTNPLTYMITMHRSVVEGYEANSARHGGRGVPPSESHPPALLLRGNTVQSKQPKDRLTAGVH